jgi:hypothetical protein
MYGKGKEIVRKVWRPYGKGKGHVRNILGICKEHVKNM